MDNKEMLELIKDVVNIALSEENVNEALYGLEVISPYELSQDTLDGMKIGMDVSKSLIIEGLEEIDIDGEFAGFWEVE